MSPHIATATAGTGMGDTTTLKNRRSALPNRGGRPWTHSPTGGSLAAKLRAPCSNVKKKPPTGTQPRRRHARGQTARLGSQHMHKRKSAVAESSTTRSCREAENPAMGVASRCLVEQTPVPEGLAWLPSPRSLWPARQAWPGQPQLHPGPCAQPAEASRR